MECPSRDNRGFQHLPEAGYDGGACCVGRADDKSEIHDSERYFFLNRSKNQPRLERFTINLCRGVSDEDAQNPAGVVVGEWCNFHATDCLSGAVLLKRSLCRL